MELHLICQRGSRDCIIWLIVPATVNLGDGVKNMQRHWLGLFSALNLLLYTKSKWRKSWMCIFIKSVPKGHFWNDSGSKLKSSWWLKLMLMRLQLDCRCNGMQGDSNISLWIKLWGNIWLTTSWSISWGTVSFGSFHTGFFFSCNCSWSTFTLVLGTSDP